MNPLKLFRNARFIRVTTCFVILGFLQQILAPMQAYALTSGPSQPEVQSFEPISTTQMVDPFTGDFTYNIPLFDVGGYPINISYHSGVSMEQEASCVGLGWNINPGVINRNLQGLPDDFMGDKIKYSENFKPQVGINLSAEFSKTKEQSVELFGYTVMEIDDYTLIDHFYGDQTSLEWTASFGLQYHNYRGVGYDVGFSKSKGLGEESPFSAWASLSYSSFEGYDAQIGLSYQNATKLQDKAEGEVHGIVNAGLGISANSRSGLKDIGLNVSLSRSRTYMEQKEIYNDYGYIETNHHTKTHNASSSYNGGMSLLGAAPSFYPSSSSNTKSASYGFSYKTGLELKGFHGKSVPGLGKISASVDWNGQDGQVIERKSAGTMYLNRIHSQSDGDEWSLDYNRIPGANGGINKFTQNIHQINQTFDIFSVSGHGTGASFRPYLGSVGVFYQPKAQGRSIPSGNLDLEMGTGDYAKIGVNLKYIHRTSYSGKWRKEMGNHVSDQYTFIGTNGNPEHELVYFKNTGERIATNEEYWNELDGASPTRIKLEEGSCVGCKNRVKEYVADKLTHSGSYTGSINRGTREPRNQHWNHLTAKEAVDFGLTKFVNTNAEDHHLAEITITGEDGRRYVYGQALYNIKQKEVSFNLEGPEGVDGIPYLPLHPSAYDPGNDNTVDNEQGKDHMFQSTEIPPYAHSFYLTAVLSTDYVDIDNNGPSPNDLGEYALFEYEKAVEDYKWRSPYTVATNTATAYRGLESNRKDDKASYIYGEKEVWYLKTVKSKSQKAVFIYDTDNRKDSYEAAGENGGRGSRKLWTLEKIELYTQHPGPVYESTYNPSPGEGLLKTVHFAYSYDLCPLVPNNIGTTTGVAHPLDPGLDQNNEAGKLTLHKIWFTYQESELGQESPYVFTYSDVNPAYDPADIDRWGNYKENNPSGRYNSEFPYVYQDSTTAHNSARAWNMTGILLPSGGKISVNYESDDYGYVQDREAMQMVDVLGFGKNSAAYDNGDVNDELYDRNIFNNERNSNNFIFVQLPEAVSSSIEFKKKYIRDATELYFKIFMNVDKGASFQKNEFIEGFAEIENSNAGITADPTVGWIELKRVGLTEGKAFKVNPISKTAWQFARLRMPYVVFPQADWVAQDDIQIDKVLIHGLLGVVTELLTSIRGFNGKMLSGGYGLYTSHLRSSLRLYSPNGRKYGGGSRVRAITFSDEWDQFNEDNLGASYTTAYEYTNEDGTSSGVASYEPLIGGEENPFKKPIHYTEKRPLALANKLYDLEPFCEFLYPAAMVGYGRVVTRSVFPQEYPGNEEKTITRHANGYSVTEFYTAKEFPTRSSATTLESKFRGTKLTDEGAFGATLASLFGFKRQGVTASQGFQIELNDMHGKLKSQATYSELSETPISKTEHVYKTYETGDPVKWRGRLGPGPLQLNNEVTVLNPDGTYDTQIVGVDVEGFAEVHEDRDLTIVPGLDMNFDFTGAGPVPLLFWLPLPKYKRVESYSATAVFTKVITRSGILQKTIATENGHSVETENIAFDAKTGSVLLTRTKNEHNDDLYSMTYPAHWAYDRMGQAYQNSGLEFDFTISGGFGYADPDVGQFLRKGDEVMIIGASVPKRYWILHTEAVLHPVTSEIIGYKFGLIDAAGSTIYNGDYRGKILRSGHRNMQGVGVGSVLSKDNPLENGGDAFAREVDFTEVLSASAVEYDESWQTFKGFHEIGYSCVEGSVIDDEHPCGDGLSFRQNRNRLRNMAIEPMCLTKPASIGDIKSICTNEECPGEKFSRKSETADPANKKIPDETDPGFDISQTKPPSINSIVENEWNKPVEPGRNSLANWIKRLDDKEKPIRPEDLSILPLLASLDNTFCTLAFPSCNTLITHIKYREEPTDTPPWAGVFYFSDATTLHCKEIFTFQYVSDVDIMKDPEQVQSMCLVFREFKVEGGVDYAVSNVIFPMFPDVKAYLWSSCPECDQNPAGEGTGEEIGFGGEDADVEPEPIPDPGYPGGIGTIYHGENPFLLGIYGNWRAKRSYIYYDTRNTYFERTQAGTFNSTNAREDGLLQDFKIFWNPPTGPSLPWTKPTTLEDPTDPWKWVQESNQYHPNGYEIQSGDRLGIFSAAYFSPVTFQPYFVVNNSDLNNSVGEGFEDYWNFFFDADCDEGGELEVLNMHNINNDLFQKMKRTSFHWNLWTNFTPFAYVVDDNAHTGNKSLKLSNQPHPSSASLDIANQTPGLMTIEVKLPATLTRNDYLTFTPGNIDLIDRFNPDKTEFYASMWVKQEDVANFDFKVTDAIVTPILPVMVNPIEGWVKREYKVVYAGSPAGIATISFLTSGTVYIDDFRIHPADANMKSFNYDKRFLRLTSSLDENNYATFFEYDLEGNLIRTKRETERGIYTITENRKNIRKVQP